MPHVLADPEAGDTVEPGLVISHRLQQRTDRRPDRAPRRPELRANPSTHRMLTADLPDRPPARPADQQRTRPHHGVVLLGEHPTGQSGLAHRQVRLRQRSSTGRPKHGVSMSRTSRRPWLPITTPQSRQPSTRAGDSTSTRRNGPRCQSPPSTAVTCSPANRREDHSGSSSSSRAGAARRRRLGHGRGLRFESLVAIDPQEASTPNPATQPRESLTPTSGTKSPIGCISITGMGRALSGRCSDRWLLQP